MPQNDAVNGLNFAPQATATPAKSGMQNIQLLGNNLAAVFADGSSAQMSPMTQDSKSRLRTRAATYLGTEFSDYFGDWTHNAEGLGSSGFVGVTPAAVVSGRSGGGKIDLDMTGAGGIGDYGQTAGFSIASSVLPLIADANWDRWFSAWRGSISAVSAVGEIGLCCLSRLRVIAATDAGSNTYIYLGVVGSVSTTFLTIKTWDGTTVRTQVTTIPIELGVNIEHEYAMGYDGQGTIDVLSDGVIKGSFNTGPLAPLPFQANCAMFMRTTSAAHNTIRADYIYAAGPRL